MGGFHLVTGACRRHGLVYVQLEGVCTPPLTSGMCPYLVQSSSDDVLIDVRLSQQLRLQ